MRASLKTKSASSPPTGDMLAHTLVSEEFLAAVPDAMVAVDHEGTIVQLNPQTQELFGYHRDELLGQKIEVLVPERYRTGHHQFRKHFAAAPQIRRMGAGLDLYGRRRDGSEFPVEISLSPVNTEKGPIVLSAIRDISDQKRIQSELRRANEELSRSTTQQIGAYRGRLASIVDSSDDAIISKDLQGVITSWNEGAERLYGYSSQQAVGQPIAMLAPPDRADEVMTILDRIRRGERVQAFESIRVTKDGRRLHVSLTVSPIREADGRVVGASVIGRDITAQKRAEDHLRQAQKMDAIGRLAGGLAHDFNNILGIINACTELLSPHVSGEPAEYATNIRKAVDRGASLTRQLLAFTKQRGVQPQVLDLNERLKETTRLLRPLMGDDVEIVVAPKSSAAFIEADMGQLDQILVNLAVNARDAMPRGGRFILETNSVRLDDVYTSQHAPLQPGSYVMLAVSDTGSGMDPETVTHIFEPFFTTKDVGKGTGLGLATVYGIVQQSRGHVWVYSEPAHGTTFKIYFPSAEDKLGAPSSPQADALPPRRETTTILLVEDDDIMRQMTRKLLDEHGYRVIEAQDAKTALEKLTERDGSVDLLLTDVVMRGMSGPELVDRLRTTMPDLKVVFMSGYTGELIASHQSAHQVITLLEKPFTRASLLNTLHHALE
jgi:PAS domain S-box-containing protein